MSFLAVLFQYGIATSVGLSAMVCGAWLSWPAAAIPVLKRGDLGFNATSHEISTLLTLMDLGSAVGPFPSIYCMNRVGRKPTIMFTAVLYIVSVLCAQFARNLLCLFVGRFLAGIAKGVGYAVVPLYVAEIASPTIRGGCSSMFFTGLNAGIMYGYVLGTCLSYSQINWAILPIPLIFTLTFYFAPESPYYLIMKDREEAAKLSLSKFRRKPITDPNLQLEFSNIYNGVQRNLEAKGKFTDLFKTKGNRKAITVVTMLSFGQKMTGVRPMFTYGEKTLPTNGSGRTPEDYLIIFAVIFFLSAFLGTILVDLVGRRLLSIISFYLCGVNTFWTGCFYHNYFYDSSDSPIWLPYLTFVLFGVHYNLGIGFLPAVLVGELFGVDVKGFASCVSSVTLALTSMTINVMFPIVQDSVGVHWMFYAFTASCYTISSIAFFIVFETKRKSLEEIQEQLRAL